MSPTTPAPRHRQLIVTVFGIFCRGEVSEISIANLITLLGRCGVEPSATRSSVSRLKKRGLLEPRREGATTFYRPSGPLHKVLAEGDERIFHPRRAKLDDPWLLVVVSVPESKRHFRHRIRSLLNRWGAGTVAPGVWIMPSLNSQRLRGELRDEQLTQFVEFFESTPWGCDDLSAKVATWWDLNQLAQLYEQFIDEWAPTADDDWAAQPPGEIFHRFLLLMTQWRRLPYLDPGLPLELLPQPWPAQAAEELMRSLHARLAPAAQAYFVDVTGPA